VDVILLNEKNFIGKHVAQTTTLDQLGAFVAEQEHYE
jgi:hypothetical protein